MKKFLKFFFIIVAFVFCLLAVILLGLKITVSGFGAKIVNSQIDSRLVTDGSIGDISVEFTKGRIGFKNFVLKEVLTNETENIISVGNFSADVGLASLFTDKIEIENFTLEDAYVNIVHPKTNAYNIVQILPKSSDESKKIPSDLSSKTNVVTEKVPYSGPSIHIREFDVKNLNLTYKDYNLCEPELFVGLKNINLKVRDLTLMGTPDGRLHSDVVLTFEMMQNRSTGYVGVWASTGIIGTDTNIPAANVLVNVTGLDIKSYSQLIPIKTVVAALGGSLVDADVKTSICDDFLSVETVISSVTSKQRLTVSGTPYKATVSLAQIVASLGFKGVMNIGSQVSNVGEAGMAAGSATFDTGRAAVEGAGKTVGKIGSGLFNTVKSTVKGDLKEAGGHLVKTGTGTVGDVFATVTNTTGTAAVGISQTGGELTNSKDADTWRSEVVERKDAAWSKAPEELKAMPYPGDGN